LDVGAAGVLIVQPERAQIDVFTHGHNKLGSEEDKR
jgi:hypothetical protein